MRRTPEEATPKVSSSFAGVTSVQSDGQRFILVGGTSFAAPHVAGLVALVRELEPGMHPRRVEQAIKQGAEGDAGRSDPEFGAGRINALDTLHIVQRSAR